MGRLQHSPAQRVGTGFDQFDLDRPIRQSDAHGIVQPRQQHAIEQPGGDERGRLHRQPPRAAEAPLELVDLLCVNETEGKELTGALDAEATVAALAARLPQAEVLLTLGPRGVWCRIGACPAALNSFLMLGSPMPAGMCSDNGAIGLGRDRACFCEVHHG